MPYCFGNNPQSDEGIEKVLQSWLNTDSPKPLEALHTWQAMTEACAGKPGFQRVNEQLAAQPIMTTVQHGDLTPWNIRVNQSGAWNVFDWERGESEGVPGWDWFHFVVQTSILTRRQSTERVAHDIEALISSDRFRHYAAKARISDITKPLFLAYLLRQKWVVQPEEGAQATSELYELLSRRWHFHERSTVDSAVEAPAFANGTHANVNGSEPSPQPQASPVRWPWLQACRQNLGWLFVRKNVHVQITRKISLREQLALHWMTVVIAWSMLLGAVALHYFSNPHMVFIPFYLVPCAMLTLMLNRRWGIVAALAAATLGPLVQRIGDSDYAPFSVWVWNSSMRFVVYLMFILLLDRMRLELGPGRGSKANKQA
jgi:hypothetical protein